jgi:hypothetical protein
MEGTIARLCLAIASSHHPNLLIYLSIYLLDETIYLSLSILIETIELLLCGRTSAIDALA